MLTNLWLFLGFLDPDFEDRLLKLKVIAKELTAKQNYELFLEILQDAATYIKNNKISPHFFNFLQDSYNLKVRAYGKGCLEITVQCPTLDSLQRLWRDTLSGHLDKVAQEYLVTSTIKTKLGVDTVKFKVTIKDYSACNESFLQLSGKFVHIFALALYQFWTFERITHKVHISFNIVTLKCILELRYLESQPIYRQFKETRVDLAQKFCVNKNGCLLMNSELCKIRPEIYMP